MDPPVNAIKFSEDLIYQIVKRRNAGKNFEKWDAIRDHLAIFQKERCPTPVLEAVLGLMEYRKERIRSSFDELVKLRVFNLNDFRFELSISAIMYFNEGYDHFKFLNFCALLGGLSVHYVKAGHNEIPEGCVQLLSYLLNFWIYSMVFNPKTDYFELACVAQRVRRNLQLKAEKGDSPKKRAGEVSAEVKDGQKKPDDVTVCREKSKKPPGSQKSPKLQLKGSKKGLPKEAGAEVTDRHKETGTRGDEKMPNAEIGVGKSVDQSKDLPKDVLELKMDERKDELQKIADGAVGDELAGKTKTYSRPRKAKGYK